MSKPYLVWRLRQAQKGRIPAGPLPTRRRDGAAADFKVLPLRLDVPAVASLDDAWRRLGLKSRTEILRRALHDYLAAAGEDAAAAHFAPQA